jgi:hypothetical protein
MSPKAQRLARRGAEKVLLHKRLPQVNLHTIVPFAFDENPQ